jgi:hypothetical protein
MTRDSSVGIAALFGLDGRDSIPGGGKRFSLLHSVETQPSIGTGSEAGHSIPSNAEVKNCRAIVHDTFSWRGA